MTAKSRFSSRHPNRGDDVIFADLIHDVHALRDLTEHGVDAVEVALRRVADEELATARVFPRVRHRQRSGDVLMGVALRLALNAVAGAAGARASVVRILG